jgi:hypothetical protein
VASISWGRSTDATRRWCTTSVAAGSLPILVPVLQVRATTTDWSVMRRRRRGSHYHRTSEAAAAITGRAAFDSPSEAWQATAAMPWAVCESDLLLRAMDGSEDWVARGGGDELMPSLLLTMRP